VQYSCAFTSIQFGGAELRGTFAAAVVFGLLATACGTGSPASPGGSITVVAGENFWGSIAAQLGGSKVTAHSVVTDPNADPHEYESNTADARAFADAALVVLNGAGYDDWGQKLLDANPSSHRTVLNIAQLLGKKPGDNPHFWYQPDYVIAVTDKITAEYKAINPTDAPYFDQQRAAFTTALKPYLNRIAEIKGKFAGVPIGSTESIFVYMASALSLNLISPPEFMNAIAEGTDPPAAAVATFHDQVNNKTVKVLVYNNQASTSVTTNLKQIAQQKGIPLIGVSETLQPVGASFQDWQVSQLSTLESALSTSK
jgi:zinc/manganese transport system substrate-binding protein